MKRLAVVALMFVALFAFAQNAPKPVPANDVLAGAYKAAKAEKKSVLVIFHASWCGWCHRLEAALASKDIKPIMDKHFRTVWLDVGEAPDKKALENPGADKTLAYLGGSTQGYPFYAVLDPNGKKLIDSRRVVAGKEPENIGHPAKPEEIAWFLKMLKDTAPRISKAELKTVETFLANQKL